MLGLRIRIRIHRNRLNPHAFGSGGNAARNFATVGDEYFCKHGNSLFNKVGIRFQGEVQTTASSTA
jgi:hypothetical protein